jgi:hypothetical protein
MEQFKEIKGFERYAISSHGRVFGVSGQEISQRKATNGYLRVNVRRGNVKYEKPTVVSVHRLVAEAFLPKIEGKTHVNHIDGNKCNNHVNNLEWCTPKENLQHAWKTGLMNTAQRNWNSFRTRRGHIRLTEEERRIQNKESHNTPEYKEKMQRINREKGNTKTILQIDISTNKIIKTYDNAHEAARDIFGQHFTTQDRLISRICRQNKGTAYGFAWKYVV